VAESVVTIGDLNQLPSAATTERPVKAIAYQADAVEVASFRLRPGAVITSHFHTNVADLFVGLSGRGEVRYEVDGESRLHDLRQHSFCGVPRNVPHEVRNVDDKEDLVFLLVHAPFAGYDHIKTAAAGSVS
jgi:mannose-6-phosphate isomerase-like protein (cupin superfamily)